MKSLIEIGIKKFESKYKYDSSYLRDILSSSIPLLLRFNQFVGLSKFRKKAPAEVLFIAKIAALKIADCGPCLQLNIDFALEQRVSPQLLQQALQAPQSLPPHLALAYEFANAVAANLDTHVALSEKFEQTFGKDALVETSMAIATAMVYPTLKRGLRHSQSCQLVKVQVGNT